MNPELTKKDRGWLLPDCRNQNIVPGLYLIATPIGNLGDITVRSLDMLVRADRIICEDTRVTGKLLKSLQIKKPLLTYNDHSTEKDRAKILGHLKDGETLALVSDAGMPLISDPGHKLVQECIAQDIHITSLPGANAVLTALQLSGLPGGSFTFLGFLPNKKTARQARLTKVRSVPITMIAFESPRRLTKTLADIADILGNREISIARELTKLHEEIYRGPVQDLLKIFEDQYTPKGEIVIVISPSNDTQDTHNEEDIKSLLKEALSTMKTKDAARFVSEKTGRPNKELYALALTIAKDK